MKYHCEGVRTENDGKADFSGPEFQKDDPDKVRYEAVHMLLQRIREDNFNENVGRADCKVLELNSPRKDSSHIMTPLRPVFEYLTDRPVDREDQFELRGDESDEEGTLDEASIDADAAFVTKEELMEHMEFPSRLTHSLVQQKTEKRRR